ncbi:hypothetical protein L916_19993, partial [Phytophthora nicotianae]
PSRFDSHSLTLNDYKYANTTLKPPLCPKKSLRYGLRKSTTFLWFHH